MSVAQNATNGDSGVKIFLTMYIFELPYIYGLKIVALDLVFGSFEIVGNHRSSPSKLIFPVRQCISLATVVMFNRMENEDEPHPTY